MHVCLEFSRAWIKIFFCIFFIKMIIYLFNAIFFYLVILVTSLCGGEPRPRRGAGVSPRDAHACKEHLYLSRLPFCFCTQRNFFLGELFQKSNRHFFVAVLFVFRFVSVIWTWNLLYWMVFFTLNCDLFLFLFFCVRAVLTQIIWWTFQLIKIITNDDGWA